MDPTVERRTSVLTSVLRLDRPPRELAASLAEFPWDAPDGPLVLLSRTRLREVLESAIEGRIPFDWVQSWSDLIECRDDIGLEPTDDGQIRQALFELANPVLTGLTTPELVRSWATKLS